MQLLKKMTCDLPTKDFKKCLGGGGGVTCESIQTPVMGFWYSVPVYVCYSE